jgi:hypothetical protein
MFPNKDVIFLWTTSSEKRDTPQMRIERGKYGKVMIIHKQLELGAYCQTNPNEVNPSFRFEKLRFA